MCLESWIIKEIKEKENILKGLVNSGYLEKTTDAGEILVRTLQSGNKILLAGNGGSAADAQHFAAELTGRFEKERQALPAISLCTDPSVVTSIGNDYGYDIVFSRQVQGLGLAGDTFIGISTSGNSNNIIQGIIQAQKNGMKVICLLGKKGGKAEKLCDVSLVVPSQNIQRIQEVHVFTIHLLCKMIEMKLFEERNKRED